MRFDYSRIKATADRLINRFGKDAVLVTLTNTGTSFDPTVTESTAAIILAEIDYSLTNRNESLVQAGDKLFLIQAAAAPSMDDKIRLDGTDYNMVDIQPLSPGSTVLLYQVQCRA